VQISATNSFGEGRKSDRGDGAVMQLVPDAPTNLRNMVSVTSSSKIGLEWDIG